MMRYRITFDIHEHNKEDVIETLKHFAPAICNKIVYIDPIIEEINITFELEGSKTHLKSHTDDIRLDEKGNIILQEDELLEKDILNLITKRTAHHKEDSQDKQQG